MAKRHGVSSSSRIIPHRYADEGDKGPWFRRLIRQREEAFWRREVTREGFNQNVTPDTPSGG